MPLRRTGAPSAIAPESSKKVYSIALDLNRPLEPVIRKMRTPRMAMAAMVISPTRNCAHRALVSIGIGYLTNFLT